MKSIWLISFFLFLSACTTTIANREYGDAPISDAEDFLAPQPRMPTADEVIPEEPPTSALAGKITASTKPEEIQKWVQTAEKGYEKLPNTDKLVFLELQIMKAFRGFRAKADALSRQHQFPIDSFFSRLIGIDVKKWSKTPALESWVSMPAPDDKSVFRNEGDIMAFVGKALQSIVPPSAKFRKVEARVFPSLTCMFGCDSKQLTTRYQALEKITTTISQLAFTCAYSLENLFVVLRRIQEPFFEGKPLNPEGKPLNAVQIKALRERNVRSLFALTTTGPQFLKISYDFAKYSSGFARASLGERRDVKDLQTPEFPALSAELSQLLDQANVIGGSFRLRLRDDAYTEINVPQFYLSPAPDLKAFMATQDERDAIDGKKEKWIGHFSRYLPQVRNANEVQQTTRVLRKDWPGGIPFPLSMFLNFDPPN
ncbi:MAG: hypothetical protein ABL958_03895 [Bdellovibrionia bacterium]